MTNYVLTGSTNPYFLYQVATSNVLDSSSELAYLNPRNDMNQYRKWYFQLAQGSSSGTSANFNIYQVASGRVLDASSEIAYTKPYGATNLYQQWVISPIPGSNAYTITQVATNKVLDGSSSNAYVKTPTSNNLYQQWILIQCGSLATQSQYFNIKTNWLAGDNSNYSYNIGEGNGGWLQPTNNPNTTQTCQFRFEPILGSPSSDSINNNIFTATIRDNGGNVMDCKTTEGLYYNSRIEGNLYQQWTIMRAPFTNQADNFYLIYQKQTNKPIETIVNPTDVSQIWVKDYQLNQTNQWYKILPLSGANNSFIPMDVNGNTYPLDNYLGLGSERIRQSWNPAAMNSSSYGILEGFVNQASTMIELNSYTKVTLPINTWLPFIYTPKAAMIISSIGINPGNKYSYETSYITNTSTERISGLIYFSNSGVSQILFFVHYSTQSPIEAPIPNCLNYLNSLGYDTYEAELYTDYFLDLKSNNK